MKKMNNLLWIHSENVQIYEKMNPLLWKHCDNIHIYENYCDSIPIMFIFMRKIINSMWKQSENVNIYKKYEHIHGFSIFMDFILQYNAL